ncbi:hypothetical protein ACOKM3_14125 [Streptomyces sp. BH106]|uniref:hypothetical protein n=1 Tax=Streptomyces sp. BH106 TaxID=3410409 RepID=UPI003CF0D2BE
MTRAFASGRIKAGRPVALYRIEPDGIRRPLDPDAIHQAVLAARARRRRLFEGTTR